MRKITRKIFNEMEGFNSLISDLNEESQDFSPQKQDLFTLSKEEGLPKDFKNASFHGEIQKSKDQLEGRLDFKDSSFGQIKFNGVIKNKEKISIGTIKTKKYAFKGTFNDHEIQGVGQMFDEKFIY